MLGPRVYLDTSVPSAYWDDRAPERQELTKRFWSERLPDFDPVISVIVLGEVGDTPDPDRRGRIERLVDDLDVLDFDEEANDLALEYVRRGVFSEDERTDARHVAIAVVNGIAFLASWNFGHLVRVSTRREVNLVNALRGYGPIEIVAPPEL